MSLVKAIVQKAAPAFKGTAYCPTTKAFKEVSLEGFAGKYLVLFFYPLDFTFVCPTEILEFSKKTEKFREIGCELLGVSTDSHFSHKAWVETPREHGGLGELSYPLYADLNQSVSQDYGVLINGAGIALRGTFIIDGKGTLRHSTVSDLPVGRSVDETIRLVKAFQFTDVHGEVCPANWTEGKPTMEPSHSSQKTADYWRKVHAK